MDVITHARLYCMYASTRYLTVLFIRSRDKLEKLCVGLSDQSEARSGCEHNQRLACPHRFILPYPSFPPPCGFPSSISSGLSSPYIFFPLSSHYIFHSPIIIPRLALFILSTLSLLLSSIHFTITFTSLFSIRT